jgi:DDE superfamily endonuclease
MLVCASISPAFVSNSTVCAGVIRSFKARYRQKLVRWLLDALHAKITRKINILEAAKYAIESWEQVPGQDEVQHRSTAYRRNTNTRK